MSTRRFHRANAEQVIRFTADILDFNGVPRHLVGHLDFIRLQQFPRGGNYTISYRGDSALFNYNDDLSTIQSGLNSLPSIAAEGGVVVAIGGLNPGAIIQIVFNVNGSRPLVSLDASLLTPPLSPYVLYEGAFGSGDSTHPSTQDISTIIPTPTLVLDSPIIGVSGFHWELSETNTPAPYGILHSNPGGVFTPSPSTYWGNTNAQSLGDSSFPAISTPWSPFSVAQYIESGSYYLFYGCWFDGIGSGTDATTPLHVHWDQPTGKWRRL